MCFTVQLSRSLSFDSHIRLSHLFWLVKNFFLFLGNFFFQEFQKFLRAPLSPTAMLEYHSISSLSTDFVNFFPFFLISLFTGQKRRKSGVNPDRLVSVYKKGRQKISFDLLPVFFFFFTIIRIKNLPADYSHTDSLSQDFLLPWRLRFVPMRYPRTRIMPEK